MCPEGTVQWSPTESSEVQRSPQVTQVCFVGPAQRSPQADVQVILVVLDCWLNCWVVECDRFVRFPETIQVWQVVRHPAFEPIVGTAAEVGW